jgi:hypothetical protein
MSPAPGPCAATTVSWLWLTDLHFGQTGQRWLWPNCREDFLHDLERIHPQCGPWDAVVFTGDQVFSGKANESDGLTPVLTQILDRIADQQGYRPAFMSVSGNHDLNRPGKSSSMVALGHWWEHSELRDEFWEDPDSECRQVISGAHSPYSHWAASNGLPPSEGYQRGVLPGDFSAVIARKGVRVGFVGLNSTFLQLKSWGQT